ncbi:MAG TPA: hypothetical protein VEG65_03270 [Candidatus Bathyarchaeia archaeon]|nr:hypothetical protein [Candidatus Bathyarchaeia archaeon]
MATNPQPSTLRISVAIIIPFAWLIFLALWLIFYASGFSLLQNLGTFVLSLAILGLLEVLLWVPWSMKQRPTDWEMPRKPQG